MPPAYLLFPKTSDVDVTGTFIESSDEDGERQGSDLDQHVQSADNARADTTIGNTSFQVTDGSVIFTPSKHFESDSESSAASDSESKSDMETPSDDEDDIDAIK